MPLSRVALGHRVFARGTRTPAAGKVADRQQILKDDIPAEAGFSGWSPGKILHEDCEQTQS